MKNLSNFVHCNGTSREKLLKTSSLLLDVRRCLEDLVRTNEEQEVNRMLIALGEAGCGLEGTSGLGGRNVAEDSWRYQPLP